MASVSSISLSGMNAAQTQLEAAAGNIANAGTQGYRRREVQATPQPEGGVATKVVASSQPGASLETDLVKQLQAKNSFLANLAVFKTSDAMAGALLDRRA